MLMFVVLVMFFLSIWIVFRLSSMLSFDEVKLGELCMMMGVFCSVCI